MTSSCFLEPAQLNTSSSSSRIASKARTLLGIAAFRGRSSAMRGGMNQRECDLRARGDAEAQVLGNERTEGVRVGRLAEPSRRVEIPANGEVPGARRMALSHEPAHSGTRAAYPRRDAGKDTEDQEVRRVGGERPRPSIMADLRAFRRAGRRRTRADQLPSPG